MNIVGLQDDWRKLVDSIKNRDSALDDREVINSKFFFKQLANEYYDMDLLSNSINSPEEKAKAKSLAKTFRQTFRDLDDTASDGNINKHILDAEKVVENEFQVFFALLNDVPDEL